MCLFSNSRRLKTQSIFSNFYKVTAIAMLYFKFCPSGHSLTPTCYPHPRRKEMDLMSIIQKQDHGTTTTKKQVTFQIMMSYID
jgi:hypothetical protein